MDSSIQWQSRNELSAVLYWLCILIGKPLTLCKLLYIRSGIQCSNQRSISDQRSNLYRFNFHVCYDHIQSYSSSAATLFHYRNNQEYFNSSKLYRFIDDNRNTCCHKDSLLSVGARTPLLVPIVVALTRLIPPRSVHRANTLAVYKRRYSAG